MKPSRPPRKQPTPQELRDEILRFIQSKFYPNRPTPFAKDRPRLLLWVVLKLAVYLNSRAVSIPTDRYLEIMTGPKGILMEALRFGDTGSISYLPAWLGKVVESHLAVHGEDYYDEGKALRNHMDAALALAKGGIQGRDPIRELAQASLLLKGKKKTVNVPRKDQLNLL